MQRRSPESPTSPQPSSSGQPDDRGAFSIDIVWIDALNGDDLLILLLSCCSGKQCVTRMIFLFATCCCRYLRTGNTPYSTRTVITNLSIPISQQPLHLFGPNSPTNSLQCNCLSINNTRKLNQLSSFLSIASTSTLRPSSSANVRYSSVTVLQPFLHIIPVQTTLALFSPGRSYHIILHVGINQIPIM